MTGAPKYESIRYRKSWAAGEPDKKNTYKIPLRKVFYFCYNS